MLAKCHYGLQWFPLAFAEVLAKELCYSVIARRGAVVRTIGNRASGSHRIPSDSYAYFAMFACLISVELRGATVVVASYQDVTGSNSLVGSSTSKDYA